MTIARMKKSAANFVEYMIASIWKLDAYWTYAFISTSANAYPVEHGMG